MVDNSTNFKYQTSKILQLLYEAGNNGLINQDERVLLKDLFSFSKEKNKNDMKIFVHPIYYTISNIILEMIMKKNPQVVKLCEQYDVDNQKDELINQLKRLCGGAQENSSSEEENPPNKTVEGLSSPGDAALIRMKKRRNSKGKKPANEPSELTMFGNSVKNCEVGLSPQIQFTKKRYNRDDDSDDD